MTWKKYQNQKDNKMAGLNRIILIGNVGQEPEISQSNAGKAIAKLSLATSDGMKDQSGNVKTEWHRIVAFGKTAEIIQNYVKKGSSVSIEGSISYGKYENKEGATVYTTDIICNRLVLLDKRESAPQQQNNAPQQQQRQPQQQSFQQFDASGTVDPADLPF